MKQSLLKLAFAAMILLLAAPLAGSRVTAQTRNLTGTVTDHEGAPIIGASIVIEGTTKGTSSSVDGTFSLSDVRSNQTVTVSYLGYVTRKLAVAQNSTINVVLNEDMQSLEDVVVVGYGVQRKSDVTGSIVSIKNDALASRSVENVQQALQGKAAGVNIFSSSAAPGSSPSVRIRGLSSNNTGASEPLYIVDGLKVSDISYLDPGMIESMEVLKDGASTAIYGVEAGNGVIMITTRKGSKENSRVFYDFTYGITSVAKKPNLMNAQQYVDFQTTSGQGTLMKYWDGVTDTNWMDVLYGEGGSIQRHTLGVEAANDKGSIFAAVSYLDNEGMYYGNKDYMNRLTFQVNATYQIKPWLQFTTNNSIESATYQKPGDGIGVQCWNSPYFYDPLTPTFYDQNNLPEYMQSLISANGDEVFMKNEDGNYVAVPRFTSDSTNPLTNYYAQKSEHKDFNVRGATAMNITPIKGLIFTSRVGYNISSSNYTFDGTPVYYAVSPRKTLDYQSQVSSGSSYTWENFATYSRTFNKHSFSLMAGMSYEYRWHNTVRGSTDKFTNIADNFHYLDFSAADAMDGVSGRTSRGSNMSYFGRLTYSFDNRFNIMVNFRSDAFDASKLAKMVRWGQFPSASVGWTITNEKFMRGISPNILSFLKLRASYGINGNIKSLGDYQYTSSLNMSDYYPMGGALIPTISPSDKLTNPKLIWEETKQVDIGIDARFLRDRLTFTMDYYRKVTDGQLIAMTAPLSSGASTVTRNVGKIVNRGFEFELGWKDRTASGFTYGVNANLSTLYNRVLTMGGAPRIEDGQSNGLVHFAEGMPVWSYYGWKYLGVNDDGTAKYQDTDNSGNINDKDKVFLGSALPKFTYGITVNLAYKGFDFTVFGNGAHGNTLCMSSRSRPYANRAEEFWTESYTVKGAGAKYPTPNVNGDTHMVKSSMQLFSGSYFKLKQIQLGYTLPASLMSKIAISKLRIFISLDNFVCITKYPGMDPEAVSASSAIGMDYGDYPTPKTVTFGANLSF